MQGGMKQANMHPLMMPVVLEHVMVLAHDARLANHESDAGQARHPFTLKSSNN